MVCGIKTEGRPVVKKWGGRFGKRVSVKACRERVRRKGLEKGVSQGMSSMSSGAD